MKKNIIAVVLVLVLTFSLGTVVFAGGGLTEMQVGIGAIMVTDGEAKEVRIYADSAANVSKLNIKEIKYYKDCNISKITFGMKLSLISAEVSKGELSRESIFNDGNVVYFLGDIKEYTNIVVESAEGFIYVFKNQKLEYMAIPIAGQKIIR